MIYKKFVFMRMHADFSCHALGHTIMLDSTLLNNPSIIGRQDVIIKPPISCEYPDTLSKNTFRLDIHIEMHTKYCCLK